MPFPLTLLYSSSNKMLLFPPVSLIFFLPRNNVRRMNTPNDDVSQVEETKVPAELRNKWNCSFNHVMFQTNDGSL